MPTSGVAWVCTQELAAAEVPCTSPVRGQPRHDRGRGEAPD